MVCAQEDKAGDVVRVMTLGRVVDRRGWNVNETFFCGFANISQQNDRPAVNKEPEDEDDEVAGVGSRKRRIEGED